jgi:hypothetical protein
MTFNPFRRRRSGAEPLSCRQFVELVNSYLEETIDARDRKRFERHLRECDGCTAFMEQLRTTIRLTGCVDGNELTPIARERLLHAFRDWNKG